MRKPKDDTLSVRLATPLATTLRQLTDRAKDPYAPTISAIVTRGIALAIRELEEKRKRRSPKAKRPSPASVPAEQPN